jgi:hypothetical protein
VSFLIDPALLYANGRAYRRLAPDASSATDAAFGIATMAVFWGVSVGLYLEQGWTKPVWKACRAASGRDWMLNSGVLKTDWRRAGTGTHLAAGAIFATYPLWLWLGMRGRKSK